MSVLIKKEYPDGYPEDVITILNSMSFTDGKEIFLAGSMALRSQIYAGDYDAFEYVDTHGSKDHALKKLVRKFKEIIKQVQSIPNTYIADIKCGTIEEWVVIGETYNYKTSISQLEKLHTEGVITEELYREGKRRIKPHISKYEHLLLQYDIRPNVIRWTPREVILGFKRLANGRKFTLEEAIETPIIAKLDVVSWVQNNRYTDFSAIYQFRHNNTLLNPGLKDFEASVKENIFKLYHEGNYLKMAKRMFSLAKFKKRVSILERLSDLFTGDVGRLYMVYGDIGTILSLFEIGEHPSRKKLDFEIDQFKRRLSNIVLEKYIHREHHIFDLIDKLVSKDENTQELLEQIKDILYDLISYYSKEYLKKHKLMPKF